MCGRFSLGVDTDRLIAEFGLDSVADPHSPRYNIAPTQPVPAVVRGPNGLRLGALRWGLVPGSSSGPGDGPLLINARAETVHRKDAFREPFARRRCWVLADGFFEWRTEGGRRLPVHFRRPDGRPFALAAIWDRWHNGGEEVVSCALLTTEANDVVRPVHDRMPVILPADVRARWLDQDTPTDELRDLLIPYPEPLQARAVSTRVNTPRNDDPSCVEPRSPEP